LTIFTPFCIKWKNLKIFLASNIPLRCEYPIYNQYPQFNDGIHMKTRLNFSGLNGRNEAKNIYWEVKFYAG